MNWTHIALLIGTSVVLAVLVSALSKHIPFLRKHAPRRQETVPPEPVTSSSVDFFYHPGEPAGYAGFTDYHAMLQTITDDLVAREFDWQFKTVGFAAGFLSAISAKTEGSENVQRTFRVTDVSMDDAEAIRWMGTMQREGTDNASPSTSNLKSMMLRVASDMSMTGPCRGKYWSEAPEDQKQDLAEAGISPAHLLEFRHLMQLAEQRGELLGAGAQIVPVDMSACDRQGVLRGLGQLENTPKFQIRRE